MPVPTWEWRKMERATREVSFAFINVRRFPAYLNFPSGPRMKEWLVSHQFKAFAADRQRRA
jgi:hypothetical protein